MNVKECGTKLKKVDPLNKMTTIRNGIRND